MIQLKDKNDKGVDILDYDFDTEFVTDQDVLDAIDNDIIAIGEIIEDDESKDAVINPVKYHQIRFVYMVMKYLTKGQNVTVSYKLNEPYRSMGSVTVEGKEATFIQSEWFSRAVGFASNVDIYALINGNVRITFTFHGLVKNIE